MKISKTDGSIHILGIIPVVQIDLRKINISHCKLNRF